MSWIGEIWRAVPGIDGILVSSEGRIMAQPRIEQTKDGFRTFGGMAYFGRWDRQQARFIVTIAGKTYRVARLVCMAQADRAGQSF